ncbi:MAG: cation-translocating P-type ATPase [Myxococcota bacterium]
MTDAVDEHKATSLEAPWARSHDEVSRELDVDPKKGLSDSEVAERRERYGRNHLREHKSKSKWRILFDQFKSLVVLLLVAAAVVALFVGDFLEAGAVIAVVLVNAGIGFFMELGAVRSMEALREMTRVQSTVLRDGETQVIPAIDIVPGDILLAESGDMISADVRIVKSSKLEADESILTGESMPMSKDSEPVEEDTVLAERHSMLYKGTSVTRGNAKGIVVETGMNTEIGKVSQLIEDVDDSGTPLEDRLDDLSRSLVWVCLGIALVLGVANYIAGRELFVVVETSIALAIATIPEGLPIVATIALAQGMRRMAKRNALVKNLAAVETLGSTGIIFTDKTGTLTLNHMSVEQIETDEGTVSSSEWGGADDVEHPVVRRCLEVAALCNNASLGDDESEHIGDPMEVALLEAAREYGFERASLVEQMPEVREVAFDEHSKKMATFHEVDDGFRVAVKGAPEAVFEIATHVMGDDEDVREFDDETQEDWEQRNSALAEQGLRILALGEKDVDSKDAEPYEGLTLLGLVALVDPPRDDVEAALAACHKAGVRVVMVTGDQPVTARYIADQVGLLPEGESSEVVRGRDIPGMNDDELAESSIFARVDPEQKLNIVDLHQKRGAIVAMTGDGVNDAPALRKADIGVAMGKRGTQVAKDAADIVLRDDAFSSIVAAIERGRVIYSNIRKFVLYLLSCNISEIAVIAIAALAFPNLPLPITPLQILFLNLVTDVFPALALGVGEGDERVMEADPRDPDESILAKRHWRSIVMWGSLITVPTLGVYMLAQHVYGFGDEQSVSMAFLVLASGQLFHVFNMRDAGASFWDNEITRNKWVWGAVALCIGLLIIPFYIPVATDALSLAPLNWEHLWLVALGGIFPMLAGIPILWRKWFSD